MLTSYMALCVAFSFLLLLLATYGNCCIHENQWCVDPENFESTSVHRFLTKDQLSVRMHNKRKILDPRFRVSLRSHWIGLGL